MGACAACNLARRATPWATAASRLPTPEAATPKPNATCTGAMLGHHLARSAVRASIAW